MLTTNRESAQYELTQIISNPKHPYNDEKSPWLEHEKAIALVNRLIAITQGREVTLEGCYDEIYERLDAFQKQNSGEGRSTRSGERSDPSDGHRTISRERWENEKLEGDRALTLRKENLGSQEAGIIEGE